MRMLVEDCTGDDQEQPQLLGQNFTKGGKFRLNSGIHGIVEIAGNSVMFVGNKFRGDSMSFLGLNVRVSERLVLKVGDVFSIKSGQCTAKLRVMELSGTDGEIDINAMLTSDNGVTVDTEA